MRAVLPDIELLAINDVAPVLPSMPAENASTFVENALIKAHFGAARCDLPALADDSGLIVGALNGAPGVYSARYAGADAEDLTNCHKLLKTMQDAGLRGSDRNAYFYCSLVLLRYPDDPAPFIGGSRWHGRIGEEMKGNNGFGYDPLFYPTEYPDRSAAELSAAAKNKISHRGKALTKLVAFLEQA